MRTTEECAKLIHQRTAELKAEQTQKKLRRKTGILSGCAMAACLVLLVGLGNRMPQIAEAFPENRTIQPAGTATLLIDCDALGYAVMGILAFFLGVCVTTLLYVIHCRDQRRKKETKQDE